MLGGANRGTHPCRSEVGDDDPRIAVIAARRPRSQKSEWSARVSVVSRDGSGGPGRLATRNAPTPSRLPPRVQGGAVCVSTSAPPRGTDGVPRWVQPWHQGARERPGRSVQVLPRVGVPRPPRALQILDPVSPPRPIAEAQPMTDYPPGSGLQSRGTRSSAASEMETQRWRGQQQNLSWGERTRWAVVPANSGLQQRRSERRRGGGERGDEI